MNYQYCADQNFEDYASGRVLYGGEGIPNFPVRLLNELFGRAVAHSAKKNRLCVYDPCCGGGYSLTVLGLCHSDAIDRLYGSDIDRHMVDHARKNAGLMTNAGLEARRREIERLLETYHKPSHRAALESLQRLKSRLVRDLSAEIFVADCTQPLPDLRPDVILSDLPYGNLVQWNGPAAFPVPAMLERLAEISAPGTILALCMDKKQRVESGLWLRMEKQAVGKRKFEILKRL